MQTACAEIADGSVDLLLTDPPYNISNNGAKPTWIDPETGQDRNRIHNQQFSESFEQDWDNVTPQEFLLQMSEWTEIWYRKLRPGGTFAIFISDRYISHLWTIMEAQGFEPKRIITWKKPAAVPFNRQSNPISGCEFILWGIKPGGKRTFNANSAQGTIVERYSAADKLASIVYRIAKNLDSEKDLEKIFKLAQIESAAVLAKRKKSDGLVNNVIPNTITFSGGINNRIHPTEKPVEILEYFIDLCSNEGDLVLDTFAGSGSTGEAAHKRNRKSILIERDKKMFESMQKRLSAYQLFS